LSSLSSHLVSAFHSPSIPSNLGNTKEIEGRKEVIKSKRKGKERKGRKGRKGIKGKWNGNWERNWKEKKERNNRNNPKAQKGRSVVQIFSTIPL